MTGPDENTPRSGFDFYGPQYSRFESELARELRTEVYGLDLGQQGWRTTAEQEEIGGLLRLRPDVDVLDVACGAGGPSLALVERTGCRLTGLDAETGGIAHAVARAQARGLAGSVDFQVFDCGGRLPFEDASFEAVLCIDAICHLKDRFFTLAEWARLLRPGGRLLFTDPAVLTGAVTTSEMEARASGGVFLLVPPGLDEQAIERANLTLLRREDRTAATALVATRWLAARHRRAEVLRREEGGPWFDERQRFLAATAELAGSRRLSRFLYLAEKPGRRGV